MDEAKPDQVMQDLLDLKQSVGFAYSAMLRVSEMALGGAQPWELLRELACTCDALEMSYPSLKRMGSGNATSIWCASDILRADTHDDTLSYPQDQE